MFHSISGGSGGEADVYEEKVGEEEVHGGVEVRVWADSQLDEQVSKHIDHAEEKPRYEGLQFWFLWESQKKKFWITCDDPRCHVVEVTTSKGKKTWLIFMQVSITHIVEMLPYIFCN